MNMSEFLITINLSEKTGLKNYKSVRVLEAVNLSGNDYECVRVLLF